ncbi:MAG: aminotransferase class I/II-fold pyridoxal phosphate-dependent enzyme [Geminicoccaceae bacterium]|nr:aminotransferase class I/II-fold pyridoxal phosphate-dependent enzyme [Geminicoccaceae bacterium]
MTRRRRETILSHGPSDRAGRISPFIVMEVMEAAAARAATGAAVYHLEVGEPGGGAPSAARAAAARALEGSPLGYTLPLGLPELRRAVSGLYRRWHGLDVPAERIAVTAGASGAFILAFLAAFDAGDRVALAEPGYPAYRNILEALDVEVVGLPTGIAEGFQPTPDLLAAVPDLDGLVVAGPANPTGSIIGEGPMRNLVGHARARGVRLVSDEIYHGLVFEGAASSALAFDDQTLVVNSFSKFFGMTGWRIGWLVMPDDLAPAIGRLAQNLFISPPAIAQHAALGALGAEDELRRRLPPLRRNRDRLLRALERGGVGRTAPAEGAFYLYADLGDLTDDSPAFCKHLLAETGIAITPGTDFDRKRGHRFARLSYAGPEDEVAAAAGLLEPWLKAQGRR